MADWKEWQARLDEAFPDGANVVHVEDVPEGIGTDGDESAHFLTPRLYVIGMEGDAPLVYCPTPFNKEVTFLIAKMEGFGGGVLITQPDENYPQFVLTRNFGPQAKSYLKDWRAITDEAGPPMETDLTS